MTASFRSIRFRISVIVAASVALAAIMISTVVLGVVAYQLTAGLDTELQRDALRIQRSISRGEDLSDVLAGECRWVIEPACYRIIDAGDAVEELSTTVLPISSEALDVADGGLAETHYTSTVASPPVRVIALPLEDQRALLVGVPTTATTVTFERTAQALVIASALSCLAAAGIGYAAGRVGVRPIRDLIVTMENVAQTADPHVTVDEQRTDELGGLARSFNTMLARLGHALDTQRAFVADASHELRTPLTTLRTNTSLLFSDRTFDARTTAELESAVRTELDGMQAMIEDLIELASLDADVDSASSQTNLVEIAVQAVVTAQRHWNHVEYTLTGVDTPVIIALHPNHAMRLLTTVLDNAGKYTAPSPDHRPEITLDLLVTGPQVQVTVIDSGSGVSATDTHRVFDRFYRAPEARSTPGSGLGLAIANHLVDQAGGSIALNARDSGGTVVTIVLPLLMESGRTTT